MIALGRREFLFGAGLGAAGGLLPLNIAIGMSNSLDVALINGHIWTGERCSNITDAIGISGDRIAALGGGAVTACSGPKTRIIDLGGAFVTPGFIDCHVHFTKASQMIGQLSLRDATSPEEFVKRVAGAASQAADGEWLTGGNWDNDSWGGELPHRDWIDKFTPTTPVALVRYDLHMMLLNSKALQLLGLNGGTPDIAGGVIERDRAGALTGIFKDAAKNMVEARIPEPSDAVIDAANRRGIKLGLSKGITQVCETGTDWRTFHSARRMHASNDIAMRFYVMVPLQDWQKLTVIIDEEGRGDEWVRWGGCKAVYDGSLGSRTALFYEPYLDDPSTSGILVSNPEDLKSWAVDADSAGLQISIHAIGDKANDDVLEIMRFVAETNGVRDRRLRIEHAQHLRLDAMAKFARQNVIASVQPYHAIDDGRWAIRRIGSDRLKTTYAFNSLLEAGAKVCFGSDWPVAPLDPLTGLSAAVLRETLDGKNPGGWYPKQRVDLERALLAYTRDAAFATSNEAQTGSLALGKLADLVVWDHELTSIEPHQLTNAKVMRTIVGGRDAFEA